MNTSKHSHPFKGCTCFAFTKRRLCTCTLPGIVTNRSTLLSSETNFLGWCRDWFLSQPSNCFLPPTHKCQVLLAGATKQALSHHLASPLCSFVFHLSRAGSSPWALPSGLFLAGSPSFVRNSPHLAYKDRWILQFYPGRWHHFGTGLSGTHWCPSHSEVLCNPSNTRSGKSPLCWRISRRAHTDCCLLQEKYRCVCVKTSPQSRKATAFFISHGLFHWAFLSGK